MFLLLYIGPMALVAAVMFYAIGNPDAGQMSLWGWVIFTFAAPFVVKPRTIPELVMTAGNQMIFFIGVMAVLVMNRL